MTIGTQDGPVFLGVGNPLLDMSITLTNADLLEKYGLKENDAILAEEKHMPLYGEIAANPNVHYTAGGATLNTIKMIQWLTDVPGSAAFFGCLGEDAAARKLKDSCDSLKLKTIFLDDKSHETGKCAVLIKGCSRSLITHLGAAQHFKCNEMSDCMWKLVSQSSIYYSAGYFLTSSTETVEQIASFFGKHEEKLFTFNLSAPFIPMFYKSQMDKILPYSDILFGNKDEASAFAKSHDLENSTASVCDYFCKLKRPENMIEKTRIAIITDGHDEIVYQVGDKRASFKVPLIEESRIVDANGAGDAFVAGFLYEYQKSKSLLKALNMGVKTAQYILLKPGFSLGDRAGFETEN